MMRFPLEIQQRKPRRRHGRTLRAVADAIAALGLGTLLAAAAAAVYFSGWLG